VPFKLGRRFTVATEVELDDVRLHRGGVGKCRVCVCFRDAETSIDEMSRMGFVARAVMHQKHSGRRANGRIQSTRPFLESKS
jgi:hypothetical protein